MNPRHLVLPAFAIAALAALLAACAGSCPAPGAAALILAPAQSSITATAIKNETKAVPVRFPGLSGWADPLSGTARLTIPLATLSTGDPARDSNVRTLFFEVGKATGYDQAQFSLNGVEGDLAKLGDEQSLTATAKGSLALHGASLDLQGLLVFSRQGSAWTVVLGDGWTVPIDKTSLVDALANLNKNCPQPHRVGNLVSLSGHLVFLPKAE